MSTMVLARFCNRQLQISLLNAQLKIPLLLSVN
jgi:hypothetical protein